MQLGFGARTLMVVIYTKTISDEDFKFLLSISGLFHYVACCFFLLGHGSFFQKGSTGVTKRTKIKLAFFEQMCMM